MRGALIIFWCFWCARVWAQSGIDVPAAGAIVDASGALRPVQGIAGNFLLGPATASGVLSAACSEKLCLAKTDSKIVSPIGVAEAPSGPVFFGLDGDEAIVYFRDTRRFARWHADILKPLDWTVEGEVLSVRLEEIAVRNNGGTSIVHPDGSVINSLPDASGPVLLLPKGVLFATRDEIVLRQDHGEVRFELTGTESIAAMGPHYAAIHTHDAIYALRLDHGHESLSLLPGSAP